MKLATRLWILPATVIACTVPMISHADPNCGQARQLLPYEARACAAARAGEDELRRFVQSTRKFYQLSFYDYATAIPAERVATTDLREPTGPVRMAVAAQSR